MRFDKIDAVVKLTERCNINCSYCYMFNKESDLFESKPKALNDDTVYAIAAFLLDAARKVEAHTVRIILHGGEPLMLRRSEFKSVCQTFIDVLHPKVKVQFTVQTNGMLISESWLQIFEEFDISVGISLDGNRQQNDANRIDHKGRGTFDRVMAGTKLMFDAAKSGRLSNPAVLCVIDPHADGAQVFDSFVSNGFKWMDFLLPIETHETINLFTVSKIEKYLASVFDAWQRKNDPEISIRIFDNFYSYMTGFDRVSGKRLQNGRGTFILTFSTDGTYGPDDTLRIVSDDYFDFSVHEDSLEDYLASPIIREVLSGLTTPSYQCEGCPWVGHCISGSVNGRVVNRFIPNEGYSGKSVLCSALDQSYRKMAEQLMLNGYPRQIMEKRLKTSSAQLANG